MEITRDGMCRFRINQREKFGCIAIQNAGTAQDARGQFELAPGLWCVDRFPFKVGDFWAGQLGHRRLEQIENSNLLILAVAPTHRPEVLDDENEALLQKVQRTFYALLLQLVFHHDGAEIFSGARQDDNPDIRTITDLRNHLRPQVVSNFKSASLQSSERRIWNGRLSNTYGRRRPALAWFSRAAKRIPRNVGG